jgi:cell division protease FtsH
LLEDNRDKVEAMTAALLEFETIDADQIDDIMAGLPARKPKPKSKEPSKNDTSNTGGDVAPAVAPKPQPSTKS